MAVNKGDRITAAQINELISKLNSECSRRGVSPIGTVVQHDPISFSKMDEINMKRIEVSKKYRATIDHPSIVSCEQRSDKTGTPSGWDGRDLKAVRLNPREDVLSIGGRAYASQYNTLLSDIEKLNAMCSCNSYRRTGCFPVCTCDQVCDHDRAEISDCGCDSVSYCPCDEECRSNRASCSCENVGCNNCKCNSTCYCDDDCRCEITCGCDGHCGCNKECKTDSVVCPSESCICQSDPVCGCDGD